MLACVTCISTATSVHLLSYYIGHLYPRSLTDEWYRKIPKITESHERTKNVVTWKYLSITFLRVRV